jgi:Fe-S cluster assembly ATP-binding protein
MLEVKKLTVKAENKTILKNISFKLKKGELIVLLGSNGGGKTSLCKSIAGIGGLIIQKGKISLKGEDITKNDISTRYEKGITYIWQKTPVLKGVMLRDLLMEKYPDLSEDEILSEFKTRMKQLNVLKFFDRGIHDQLSGGESKRLELFISTLDDEGRVFLFDEPDSGVDSRNVKRIGEYISSLFEGGKNSGILITHSEKILEYLDVKRAVVIENGEIVNEGSLKKILDNEVKGGS